MPTTENTGGDWYWEWYLAPGNSLRERDEAEGIIVVENEMGRYFAITREALNARSSSEPQPDAFPDYFAGRTLDRFSLSVYSQGPAREKAKAALALTRRYIENIDTVISQYGGGGLYYCSRERGSGKTFLSTILGNELLKRGRRVRWVSVTSFLQELKASYDRESGTSSAEIIGRCRNAPVLILDDIGVEKQSAWVNETMYSLLDFRMTHARPTIFTSNLKPDELGYDERVLDRIARMTELVEMPEENVRRRLNAKSRLGEFLRK